MKSAETVRTTIRAMQAVTGETQGSLADAMGVSRQKFGRIMNGVVTFRLEDLDSLAEHWMVRTADLLQGPAHAISSLPTAPRQRDRTSAA